jgi:putative transposase
LAEIERDYYRKLERYLDKGCGECWLRRPEIADLVAEAVPFFEGERYRLDAWVVMPNHVHAVLWPMPNHTLSAIAQSWKRHTAREANKILKRTGEPFWQPEPFDHWIRNDAEHARCCRYTVNNPVKAGLCTEPQDWRWSSAWREPNPSWRRVALCCIADLQSAGAWTCLDALDLPARCRLQICDTAECNSALRGRGVASESRVGCAARFIWTISVVHSDCALGVP